MHPLAPALSRVRLSGAACLVLAAVLGFSPADAGAKTITVDGDLSDWAPSDRLYEDAEIGDGAPANSTYANLYVANNATFLFVGMETKGTGGGSIANSWTRNIYIDTDLNPGTGFNGGWMSGGYDRLVQYGASGALFSVFEFTGGTNQAAWAWAFQTTFSYASGDSAIELAIPRSALGMAPAGSARLEFNVTGGAVTVETWAHASESLAKTYTTTELSVRTIVIDGDLSDWDADYLFYEDPEIGDGQPLNSTYTGIYAANDASFLYVALDVKGTGGAHITNNWIRNLLIDTDLNPDTGFDGGWMSGGYDRLVEYGDSGAVFSVHEFSGAGSSDWAWSFLGEITYSFSDSVVEYAVPRTHLAMGTNDKARLEFTVSGGDVTVETWAHVVESQVKTYTFAASPPIPAIDAIDHAGGTVELALSGLSPGASNRVQRALTLEPESWSDAGLVTSSGSATNWSETVSPAWTNVFYRVLGATP